METNLLLLKAPKGSEKDDPFLKKLCDASYNASCLPVLSFSFCNLGELRAALLKPEEHSGIIFTSQRAVEAATKAIKDSNDTTMKDWKAHYQPAWRSSFCFCVGKATAEAARKLGFHTLGEEAGSAEALVPEIMKGIESSRLPLIYPCGNLRRDTISAAASEKGIKLNEIVCYETTPDENIMSNFKSFMHSKGFPTHLVYFSPSGVEYTKHVIEELQLAEAGTKFIAIGATTKKALDEKGLEVFSTAAHPTPEGLLEALLHARQVRQKTT